MGFNSAFKGLKWGTVQSHKSPSLTLQCRITYKFQTATLASFCKFPFNRFSVLLGERKGKGKGKEHPCTGTEALYRPYGP